MRPSELDFRIRYDVDCLVAELRTPIGDLVCSLHGTPWVDSWESFVEGCSKHTHLSRLLGLGLNPRRTIHIAMLQTYRGHHGRGYSRILLRRLTQALKQQGYVAYEGIEWNAADYWSRTWGLEFRGTDHFVLPFERVLARA